MFADLLGRRSSSAMHLPPLVPKERRLASGDIDITDVIVDDSLDLVPRVAAPRATSPLMNEVTPLRPQRNRAAPKRLLDVEPVLAPKGKRRVSKPKLATDVQGNNLVWFIDFLYISSC